MSERTTRGEAVGLLQQLGLKEYEAKTFVALARRETGTAKDVSETSEVPRTRVYDAIRVLESKGLVETQHSKPQLFRAVSVEEAVDTLRSEYLDRAESLRDTLRGLEPAEDDAGEEVTHDVWALSGERGIASRTEKLVDDSSQECILVLGHESAFTEGLVESLQAARERGVDVLVGTVSEDLQATVREAVPEVEVFVSGLEWLGQSTLPGDDTEIGRLLLVDREAILVSSFVRTSTGDRHEQGVFGRGFDNGLVAIVRRLMATGLVPPADPASEGDA
jgi:sugar-specific transcriptional regulator TrmB